VHLAEFRGVNYNYAPLYKCGFIVPMAQHWGTPTDFQVVVVVGW